MVEMKPEKDGNFIKRTMDEKQANKKNPQFGWSETQNFKTKWKHKQWMTTVDDMLQAFNVCTNQNVKENLPQEQNEISGASQKHSKGNNAH